MLPGLLPRQWLIFADVQANGGEDLELLFHREKGFGRDKLIHPHASSLLALSSRHSAHSTAENYGTASRLCNYRCM